MGTMDTLGGSGGNFQILKGRHGRHANSLMCFESQRIGGCQVCTEKGEEVEEDKNEGQTRIGWVELGVLGKPGWLT